ncbi:MAG: dolichyl-phosphate-mannose--protein mannosyltransferase [Bacteroidales bacterium]|nr:dolichyl-phosphate-mannose--protein mannosyltransferase [Bacteroidales bacterium]
MKRLQRLMDRYPVGSALALAFLGLIPWMVLRDFTPANELRYLSIVDEALRDGHFFAFSNQGVPYADKPPLYFWLLMLCRVLLGHHSMPVLALFSCIPAAVVTWVMDRWVFGADAAHGASGRNASPAVRRTAALMLFSSVTWLGLSMFLRMDMLMTMFIVLALYAWHRDRPWAFALFTFLALFSKGPVGILMPPLVVLTAVLTVPRSFRRERPGDPHWRIGRFLGWRFFLLVGACCAVWFTAAWLEGGSAYLQNLLFHQTVDRTVNAFHHKEPFWFYLVNIWPILLPWSLLTVPVCVASLCRRGDTAAPRSEAARAEKLLRCAFFVPIVMLSLSSSKLPVYLLPVFPFSVYLLPLYVQRAGWRKWNAVLLALSAGLFALIGLGLAFVPLIYQKIPFLAEHPYAHSGWFTVCGILAFAGSLWTFVRALRRQAAVTDAQPMAVAILLAFLSLAPELPEANDYLGYGALCRAVPDGEKVYVLGIRRPENMDVYLGRDIVVLEDGDPIPSDGVLITKDNFRDPAVEGRPQRILGKRIIWLPAGSGSPR